jgi:hypothetical protein
MARVIGVVPDALLIAARMIAVAQLSAINNASRALPLSLWISSSSA